MSAGVPVALPGAETARRIERETGRISTASMRAMTERLSWFPELPPEERSWVAVVAGAGLAAFVGWLRAGLRGPALQAGVFGVAPQELTRIISLQQTVELVRVAVDVVESQVEGLAADGEEEALREAVLRFSREVAFAVADVYARAAEERGAWDARLEALVVHSLLRGETGDEVSSRAAALGWRGRGPVAVVIGGRPAGSDMAVLGGLQRAARAADLDVLAAVQDRLVAVVVGGAADPGRVLAPLLGHFAPGPVVIGPSAPDLAGAGRSAEEALAGWRAAPGWPAAPRPVRADDLLAERAVDGDPSARAILVDSVWQPLCAAGGGLLETVTAYLDGGGTIEGAGRALFVHPNTVRYRLRRVAEVCGASPLDPRGASVLRTALILGRTAAGGTDR